MKIFHEAPKSIFKDVQSRTDGDYFLVHLFEEDSEYLKLAEEAVASSRETILDNSIFELGEAFDAEKFAKWVNKLKPTYYIVPDSLENYSQTVNNMREWNLKYSDTIDKKCKKIGVIQGKTFEELLSCYDFMVNEAKVDKVAIPFDLSYYQRLYPHSNKYLSWAIGRSIFLNQLISSTRNWTDDVKWHLLGCGLPQEFKQYSSEDCIYNRIDSVDTSNPIIHGMSEILYDSVGGLESKLNVKLFTKMNEELTEKQVKCVEENISIFKSFCSGKWYLSLEE